jgi:hypothetical protein
VQGSARLAKAPVAEAVGEVLGMSWIMLLTLAGVSYALKAVGPLLAGGRQLGAQARSRERASTRGSPSPPPSSAPASLPTGHQPDAHAGGQKVAARDGGIVVRPRHGCALVDHELGEKRARPKPSR